MNWGGASRAWASRSCSRKWWSRPIFRLIDLPAFFAHQLRWARGVRDARLAGYIGLVSTFGIMWALLALIAAQGAAWSWATLGAILLLRGAVVFSVGKLLQDQHLLELIWLLPIRDLIAAGVWLASFVGHTVTWRGDRFELKKGRLVRIVPCWKINAPTKRSVQSVHRQKDGSDGLARRSCFRRSLLTRNKIPSGLPSARAAS